MTSLVVDRIESEEGLLGLEPEWRSVERSSKNTLPFRTFAWTACWWRHLHEERLAVKDSLVVHAVRTPSGRLVGVAPLMLTERPGRGPLRTRCLQFVGADPNLTEVRGALFEPDFEGEGYRAILAALEPHMRHMDWVRWTGIEEAGGAALADAAPHWTESTVCLVLPLSAPWEEFSATRPRNLKAAVRHSYNSLKRDGLSFALEVVTRAADVEMALRDFFRLHAARADLTGTVAHKNVFAHPACRAFLIDVCKRFASDGALRIFRLHVRGRLVATRVGFVLHDTLYFYYSGFDPEFGRYGVMMTTVAEALKHATAEGVRNVNLSTGVDEWKMRWRPAEVVYREAFLFPPHGLGRAKYEMVDLARNALTQSRVQRLFARRAPTTSPR